MLEQKQQLKQTLRLSPQQIQLMKLIHLSNFELNDKIEEEIQENPALADTSRETEVDNNKDVNNTENVNNQKDLQRKSGVQFKSSADLLNTNKYSNEPNLYEYLENQIIFFKFNKKELEIAKYIIGNLDNNGYFRDEIINSIDNLFINNKIKVSEKEFLEVLKKIQTLDPPGIAAQNLQECLINQLLKKEKNTEVDIAIISLSKYFNEFTKKHFDIIAKKINMEKSEFEKVINIILKLNPFPGRGFERIDKNQDNINIDFVVKKVNDKLEVTMPKAQLPELKINNEYEKLLNKYSKKIKELTEKEKQTYEFVKQKINNALWFIDAIKQRQNTLYNTMVSIVEFQNDFFETGETTKLKPMILKDIANKINMDQSTISRVVNKKYVLTDYGVFPLKHFFSESLTTIQGDEISNKAIRKIIYDLISRENKNKPLSDLKISKQLKTEGYIVARRTVAKYRDLLNIPVARLRKTTL